jgi:putative ABC transport system permease protein
MSDLLYLSGQYIRHHKNKLLILIFAITLVSWLPIAIQTIVDQTAEQLLDRANNTPLVIGAPGSPLELALGSLYFRTQAPETLAFEELAKVEETGFARAIPLYYRFNAQGHPIVGTNPDYLAYRKLQFAQGRAAALLGEAVLGADVARVLELDVGDFVISSPESVFNIAGVYPLKMPVVGILEPAFSPDDQAIFVDIKTSWVIQGLGHGHQDLTQPSAESAILARDGSKITANASIVEYNEITPANIDSFHFHGDIQQHPVSAVLAVPRDEKSRVLLLGRYQGDAELEQIFSPVGVMQDLLDTIFTIQAYAVAAIGIIAVATLSTVTLVFLLSLRLRRRELETLVKLGGARTSIASMLISEVLVVLLLAASAAGALTLVASRFGNALIRSFILT